MSFLTRTMLPAFALAAMMSAAQAQPATQDHDAHHPDAAPAPAQAQPQPQSQPGMMPGMMMGMDQMRPMMGGMMGQQDGSSGMMGTMMPMMRQMMMGQQGGMGAMGGAMGLPFEHAEGRIAFLKAELKITDAQVPQWNAVADALRASAKAHQVRHEQMSKGGMPASWPERLNAQLTMLNARLEGLKALEAAAKPLYAVLTAEQKTLADKLFSGPMGMM